MRLAFKFFLFSITFIFFFNCEKEDKKSENWVKLFNGKDLTDWTVKINGFELNNNYNNTFRVENGVMKVSYDNYENFTNEFGHIFYKKPFSNYKLRLQYRFIGTASERRSKLGCKK